MTMTTRRYQLVEHLPYPRATRRGHLADPTGVALHGTYERKIPGGYRAAVINNGTVVHRYDYASSIVGAPAEPTRSFANLVHTLNPWRVPDDAERPVTNYPASEFPHAGWRSLWCEPIILNSLLRDTKRVGLLAGGPAETEQWTDTAREQGFVAAEVRAWNTWDGAPWTLILVAPSGPVTTDHDVEKVRAEYAAQMPHYDSHAALDRLSTMAGDDLEWHRLVNPASADDLLVTGYCFGYPVSTTTACMLGTHG